MRISRNHSVQGLAKVLHAQMPRETTITVPTEDASFISDALADAGLAVLDTGRRITTDEGPEAETVLTVAELGTPEEGQATRASTPVRP